MFLISICVSVMYLCIVRLSICLSWYLYMHFFLHLVIRAKQITDRLLQDKAFFFIHYVSIILSWLFLLPLLDQICTEQVQFMLSFTGQPKQIKLEKPVRTWTKPNAGSFLKSIVTKLLYFYTLQNDLKAFHIF